MKTNIILNKGWQLLLTIALATSIYSCKKADPNEDLDAPRIFKPSGITVRTTETEAKITWTAPLLSSNLKLAYATEFSQDSTFATSEFSLQTDTAGITVAEDKLKVRQKYYVRVKALSTNGQPESNWMVSRSFTISGEQVFELIRDLEIKETQITLRWKPTTGLDKITLQKDGGAVADYPITGSEAATGIKVITGLDAGTGYTAEIYQGTRSKGFRTFKTLVPIVYHVILNSGDNLVTAIANAPNDAVIGLNPGVYSAGTNTFVFAQKSLTIKSISGNPEDTKVNFREFTLRGNGAGVKLEGIELDGTASSSSYFINLTGAAADAEQASFANISVNNCIVHGVTNSFIRGDRGAPGAYKIESITINNSKIYDFATALSYLFLHLNDLQFGKLDITKSTIYNFGHSLITCSVTLTGTPHIININYCTLNNGGASNASVLMDAGANPTRLNITNSIIANVPRTGATVNAAAVKSTGAGSGILFSNNNTFNFVTASGGTTLTFPSTITSMANNQTINLGWTNASTTFPIPVGNPLRTASTDGTPIGDPRWTY